MFPAIRCDVHDVISMPALALLSRAAHSRRFRSVQRLLRLRDLHSAEPGPKLLQHPVDIREALHHPLVIIELAMALDAPAEEALQSNKHFGRHAWLPMLACRGPYAESDGPVRTDVSLWIPEAPLGVHESSGPRQSESLLRRGRHRPMICEQRYVSRASLTTSAVCELQSDDVDRLPGLRTLHLAEPWPYERQGDLARPGTGDPPHEQSICIPPDHPHAQHRPLELAQRLWDGSGAVLRNAHHQLEVAGPGGVRPRDRGAFPVEEAGGPSEELPIERPRHVWREDRLRHKGTLARLFYRVDTSTPGDQRFGAPSAGSPKNSRVIS